MADSYNAVIVERKMCYNKRNPNIYFIDIGLKTGIIIDVISRYNNEFDT